MSITKGGGGRRTVHIGVDNSGADVFRTLKSGHCNTPNFEIGQAVSSGYIIHYQDVNAGLIGINEPLFCPDLYKAPTRNLTREQAEKKRRYVIKHAFTDPREKLLATLTVLAGGEIIGIIGEGIEGLYLAGFNGLDFGYWSILFQ